ncbi:diketogulonate reductase-like aldo/keto reductase [Paenibacillus sp. DS2015]|uniref:aldo/keto reductase n=1 Tax=Paenibacillus sp. DS2015 TaxID=3373917 RepID=UPI003D1DBFA2
MVKSLQDTTMLSNGVKMPWLGLGVFKVEEGSEVVHTVKNAIKLGYRSIDTAAAYRNEEGVGQGILEGIQEAGLTREDIFVTSKVWNPDQGYESTLAAFDLTMNKLGLEYLDLYLVHWPVKTKYKDTWRAIEKLYTDKRVRAIGVSNFHVHHLEDLLQDAEITPMVNQVEYHPRLAQLELRSYCKEKGIQLEAWSPLMQGKLLDHPVLKDIANQHSKSVAQVILRWDIQNGFVTIPKSVKEERMIENSNIFDFELSVEDMKQIEAINDNTRVGSDPDNFNF